MNGIHMGALADPLVKQLPDVSARALVLPQRLADAVTLCAIHSILSEAETHRARKRIVKMIERAERAARVGPAKEEA